MLEYLRSQHVEIGTNVVKSLQFDSIIFTLQVIILVRISLQTSAYIPTILYFTVLQVTWVELYCSEYKHRNTPVR